MSWSSTFKTTIPLGNYLIVPLSISNICVARTSAVAGKVPYLVTFVAFLSTRAIVMKMALGALRQVFNISLHIIRKSTDVLVNLLSFISNKLGTYQ
ncbi:hypothetical protein Tco_0249066, partial [Tanacetum coccineum]